MILKRPPSVFTCFYTFMLLVIIQEEHLLDGRNLGLFDYP